MYSYLNNNRSVLSMRKIAIMGRIASGKTTTANELAYLLGPGQTKITSFASIPKQITHRLWEFHNGIKPRKHYIHVAESMKQIDPYVWARATLEEIKQWESQFHIIIDDTRFDVEIETLIDKNYEIYALDIDDNVQKMRICHTYPDNADEHLDVCRDEKERFDSLLKKFKHEIKYIPVPPTASSLDVAAALYGCKGY